MSIYNQCGLTDLHWGRTQGLASRDLLATHGSSLDKMLFPIYLYAQKLVVKLRTERWYESGELDRKLMHGAFLQGGCSSSWGG